jgi:hypothetical protein
MLLTLRMTIIDRVRIEQQSMSDVTYATNFLLHRAFATHAR